MDFTEARKEIKVDLSCPNCAKKIERRLNEFNDIDEAILDFENQILYYKGNISEEIIKERALGISDEISFPSNEGEYIFNVSIDCPNCAKKIENHLNSVNEISQAVLDFNNGTLKVKTTLSKESVMMLSKQADDEIVFLSDDMDEREKDPALLRIVLSIALLSLGLILDIPLLLIASYLTSGYDVILKAIRNVFRKRFIDESFLMTIATIAALVISSYEEATAVMLFYQIGEYFQRKATAKSRKSISSLFDLTPEFATLLTEGKESLIKAEEIRIGDVILIRPGEKVAIDGVVIKGSSFLDTKALTGESREKRIVKGDVVLSGSINLEGPLEIKATHIYEESTASKIIKLTRESEGRKAESEMFITRFSRYYTPIIIALAILLATIPPLLKLNTLTDSIYRACMLLVISCPCALVLSVPLAYFASIGSYAKNGILIKGSSTIESLCHVDVVAFDKTGTLTEGDFSVTGFRILSEEVDEERAKELAYALERSSSHPIAKAILRYIGHVDKKADKITEMPGLGIKGEIDGISYSIGSIKLLKNHASDNLNKTAVFLLKGDDALAVFYLSDKIKKKSAEAIKRLKSLGIEKTYMLSGDRREACEDVANELGIDEIHPLLLPQDKMGIIEEIRKNHHVAFIGDGINDAPSMQCSDVGFAMGGIGADIAIEAADAVILDDDINRVAISLKLAKRTDAIVKENIFLSLSFKALVLMLAFLGRADMLIAVLADTGVALIAVLNSMRALRSVRS